MRDQLKTVVNKAVVAYFNVLSWQWFGRTEENGEENSIHTADVHAQTRNVYNTKRVAW